MISRAHFHPVTASLFRLTSLHPGWDRDIYWEEETPSMVRAQELDECEEKIRNLPPVQLFDDGLSDVQAKDLYLASYDYEEKPFLPVLPTLEDMRSQVLARLGDECSLLLPLEDGILQRAVKNGGQAYLMSADELLGALSLARRLWISIVLPPDGTVQVTIPQNLLYAISPLLLHPQHKEIISMTEKYLDWLTICLSTEGMVFEGAALLHLQECLGPVASGHPDLCRRFFRSCYPIYDHPVYGRLIMHPGISDKATLADRACCISPDPFPGVSLMDTPPDDQYTSWSLSGLVANAVRPEISAYDVVSDLVMLCRMGVPFEKLESVLASMLIIQPTPQMLRTLRQMTNELLPWPCAPTVREVH